MTETRAEKAQRLVDEGRVSIDLTTKYGVCAHVTGDSGTYGTITHPTGLFFCTCSWGQVHSYTDDLCAHALAVKLAIEKENKE